MIENTPIEQLTDENVLKLLNPKIAAARLDRSRRSERINRFYDLALPDRIRVSSNSQWSPHSDRQDEVFDQYLQMVVSDHASDMSEWFTPMYKPWVELRLKESRGPIHEDVRKALKQRETVLFESIRESDYYLASENFWEELSGAHGGLKMPYVAAGSPLPCEFIPASRLLMERVAANMEGAVWDEMYCTVEELLHLYPDAKLTPKLKAGRANKRVRVIEGQLPIRRPDREKRYFWHVIADGDIVAKKVLEGEGSAPMIAAGWTQPVGTAYPIGPAQKALSTASVQDELAYIHMKREAYLADPAAAYDQDGLFNPLTGVDPGTWHPRRQGSKIDWLVPPGRGDDLYFDKDEMRQFIQRVLYQDKPYQRGDTPPTAAQWLDERSQTDTRLSLARGRLFKGVTLPLLHRYNWILSKNGTLPPFKLNNTVTETVFRSPLSKAAELQDVQRGEQVMRVGASYLGEQAMMAVDGFETLKNIKAKLGDEIVVLRKPEEQPQQVMDMLGSMRNLSNGPTPQ